MARLIDADALFEPVEFSILLVGGNRSGKTAAMYEQLFRKRIELAPTVDAVPLDQYNELKERFKRLLETADILDSALGEYQRKYGDLDDEDAKMDGDGNA